MTGDVLAAAREIIACRYEQSPVHSDVGSVAAGEDAARTTSYQSRESWDS